LLLMCHEPAPRALVELMQIEHTPSGAAPVLQDAPEAFHGMPRMITGGREPRPPTLRAPMGSRRRQLRRPVEATTRDHHDAVFPRVAQERHPWMARGAPALRRQLGDDRRADLGGAIVDSPKHAEPHAAGHAPPTPRASPRLAFAGRCASDVVAAQRPGRQSIALSLAGPPARPGERKTPEDGGIFIEHKALAATGPGLAGGQGERRP
jgi:hypothetical protein